MPKNLTGGNRHKKGKNSTHKAKRTIVYPDNKETLFAYAINALGDSRFNVKCSDEVDRVGSVRGGLRGVFINPGDLVLVGLRGDLSAPKAGKKEVCDILLKYSLDEIGEIRQNNLLVYKGSTKTFSNNMDLNKVKIDGNNITQVESDSDEESDHEFDDIIKEQHNKPVKTIQSTNKKSEESESEESFDLDKEFDNL